jgi:aminoglycoside phosphotransferase (APT) family kinase protein
LLRAQFPDWAELAIAPVPVDGWDNRTYRLGSTMSVRLPTAAGYVPAVAKEARWLPRLAEQLPVAVPSVLGLGRPGEGYPFPWSVRGWLDGESALDGGIDDLPRFATSVGEFLVALQRCDPAGGPPAGEHSWYRGAPLRHYDAETRECLPAVRSIVDTELAARIWDRALAAEWTGRPVWFHGDVAAGNLIVRDGRLAAVIDFGTSGVGDPACDLVIAWTLFSGPSRRAFRDAIEHGCAPAAMWARARGWALWKALLGLRDSLREQTRDDRTDDGIGDGAGRAAGRVARERRLIADLLADPVVQ